MRAVNLLPERDRVRGPATVPAGSSRVVLGVLGALLLAVLVMVFTQNKITGNKADIAQAQQEQQQAEQRSAQLGSFGQFSQIKATRVSSISALAKSRFDYERLMRELALVLPQGTSITEVNASTTGAPDGAAGAAPAPAPAPASGASTATTSTGAAATGPSVKIVGCAKTQSAVAETMVRLRNLDRADDVQLTDSSRAAEASGSSGAAPTSDAGSGGAGCGKHYAFDATVTFAAGPVAADGKGEQATRVPTTLGGGS